LTSSSNGYRTSTRWLRTGPSPADRSGTPASTATWLPGAEPGERRRPWPYDKGAYRERNKVERLFCKLKNYRRLATRYEKLTATFKGLLHLVFATIAIKAL
jgi:transposase